MDSNPNPYMTGVIAGVAISAFLPKRVNRLVLGGTLVASIAASIIDAYLTAKAHEDAIEAARQRLHDIFASGSPDVTVTPYGGFSSDGRFDPKTGQYL